MLEYSTMPKACIFSSYRLWQPSKGCQLLSSFLYDCIGHKVIISVLNMLFLVLYDFHIFWERKYQVAIDYKP